MQVKTFCWLPLRRGAILVSAACFVMAVINAVAASLPELPGTRDENKVPIGRSVHAVLGVVYAAAGALLGYAIYQGSVLLVRLWLCLFGALALASLLAHDLARYNWFSLEVQSPAAVLVGVGLVNIVLDMVFLMAIFALLREMEREEAEDVAAASRPRPPRHAPGVAPPLPLRELVAGLAAAPSPTAAPAPAHWHSTATHAQPTSH